MKLIRLYLVIVDIVITVNWNITGLQVWQGRFHGGPGGTAPQWNFCPHPLWPQKSFR